MCGGYPRLQGGNQTQSPSPFLLPLSFVIELNPKKWVRNVISAAKVANKGLLVTEELVLAG